MHLSEAAAAFAVKTGLWFSCVCFLYVRSGTLA